MRAIRLRMETEQVGREDRGAVNEGVASRVVVLGSAVIVDGSSLPTIPTTKVRRAGYIYSS